MSTIKNEPAYQDSGTAENFDYVLVAKEDTKFPQFKAFVRTLPDGGQGVLNIIDQGNCSSYLTSITNERAMELAKEPFIDRVLRLGPTSKTEPVGPARPRPEEGVWENPRCQPSGTSKPVRYLIFTKEGTPLETFQSFIKTLPDGGYDHMADPDDVDQSCTTTITYEKAKEIVEEPFVDFVMLADMGLNTNRMMLGAHPRQQDFQTRLTDDQHLGILSRPPPGMQPVALESQSVSGGSRSSYTFDPALGRGQMVYIIDQGFDMHHSELESIGRGRTCGKYVVPNYLTLTKVNRKYWPEESDLTDHSGHGTAVASIAVGKTHGVAPNANFTLVKMWQAAEFEDPITKMKEHIYVKILPSAIKSAWNFIVRDVKKRRNAGDKGQSIIVMSIGFQKLLGDDTEYWDMVNDAFDKLLRNCWRNDIITVVTAGNNGECLGLTLETQAPQSLGTLENALITVGGVYGDGTLWPKTSFDAGRGGSMTVYAVADGETAADGLDRNPNSTSTVIAEGTSYAAPAVAGLAAYFASLSSLSDEWREGQKAWDMKRYIEKHLVQRRAVREDQLPPSYFLDRPPHIPRVNVAYNRAFDGLCSARKPLGDEPPPAPFTTNRGNINRRGSRGGASRGRGRGNQISQRPLRTLLPKPSGA